MDVPAASSLEEVRRLEAILRGSASTSLSCALCPVGYICPDLGMSRPIVCPPGAICDVMGLRYASKGCPQGHYCLNGTKAATAMQFANDSSGVFPPNSPAWIEDYTSGVYYYNSSVNDYSNAGVM